MTIRWDDHKIDPLIWYPFFEANKDDIEQEFFSINKLLLLFLIELHTNLWKLYSCRPPANKLDGQEIIY